MWVSCEYRVSIVWVSWVPCIMWVSCEYHVSWVPCIMWVSCDQHVTNKKVSPDCLLVSCSSSICATENQSFDPPSITITKHIRTFYLQPSVLFIAIPSCVCGHTKDHKRYQPTSVLFALNYLYVWWCEAKERKVENIIHGGLQGLVVARVSEFDLSNCQLFIYAITSRFYIAFP